MSTINTRPHLTPPPSGLPPEPNLAPGDVEALGEELLAYHQVFSPLFLREEQRHWALRYLQGQVLELERKAIAPLAQALEGGNVQAMQQFISAGAWDDAVILQRHQELVAQTLGDDATGVLILDGCDFPKQGKESVGVAPQWCGALGKVANCQASVLACYASRYGYTLVDRRLFLPERWFTDAYQDRRQRCGVPEDQTFHTKPELAWEMLEALVQQAVVPFAWVTCDEDFGKDPVFLDRVAGAGVLYLAEVPHSTRVWRDRPRTEVPAGSGRRRPPTHERVLAEDPDPVGVQQLAEQVKAEEWSRQVIKEGSKGTMVAEFAFRRAVAVRDGLPGPDVWVVLRRSLGEVPELKTYLSNAPRDTPTETLVRLSGMRWPVESAIKESKSEVGMDQYEVRGWRGWHHHLTMSLLAHHFLVRLRRRWGEKISGRDGAAGAPAPAGGAAQTRTRRRDGARAHRADPTPELCRLPLPSAGHPTSSRYVMMN